MPLNNSRLRYYDHNVLRLPRDKRTTYTAQVNRLIDRLTEKLHEHTEFKVSRVIKAGSFAKHTILRKAEGREIDVDLAFYLADRAVDHSTYESLSEEIHELLVSLYPSKGIDDFQIQKKAATVRFVGTGLSVDVVPVIERAPGSDDGYQFTTDGQKILTCAPCQLQFLKTRKDRDADFRTLIRLAKQWRHHHGLPGLKGYSTELLMASMLDQEGTAESIENRFRRFLLSIAQDGLKQAIAFPENSRPVGQFTDPVVVLDPSNSANNVTARISEQERQTIVQQAQASYEDATIASVEDDAALWKEVFGPRFRVEDAS
ncbi:CBASS oligonucleotide cyclase [uncultured Deinococcus sp.]|uniref:CBASS oligonucleotide cyclase n=1 Tax=uncultured Deinococcus sp. TaxID=158789 RepID=UPI0025CD2515|nr:CBASS oligonucleotide cyclase [uncultured Deinococcus sp.]